MVGKNNFVKGKGNVVMGSGNNVSDDLDMSELDELLKDLKL